MRRIGRLSLLDVRNDSAEKLQGYLSTLGWLRGRRQSKYLSLNNGGLVEVRLSVCPFVPIFEQYTEVIQPDRHTSVSLGHPVNNHFVSRDRLDQVGSTTGTRKTMSKHVGNSNSVGSVLAVWP